MSKADVDRGVSEEPTPKHSKFRTRILAAAVISGLSFVSALALVGWLALNIWLWSGAESSNFHDRSLSYYLGVFGYAGIPAAAYGAIIGLPTSVSFLWWIGKRDSWLRTIVGLLTALSGVILWLLGVAFIFYVVAMLATG